MPAANKNHDAAPQRGSRADQARPFPALLLRCARPLTWIVIAAVGVFMVQASWMKWIDLLVDSGREFYLPWRVLLGEHLGRDFVHPYGPLSVYFNAAIFAVFGVEIRNIVLANLVIFGAIVVLTVVLLRRAFGYFPSVIAVLFAIVVFGFSQLVVTANYNFAAPYSHEATHGLLLLLGLLACLTSSRPRRGVAAGVWIGCLVGLLWLTKAEYVFASVMVLAAHEFHHRLTGAAPGDRYPWLSGLTTGIIAIMGTAGLLLSQRIGLRLAFKVVTGAVLGPVYFGAYSSSPHVLHFLGADHPGANLLAIVGWSMALALAAWSIARILRLLAPRPRAVQFGVATLLAAGVALAAFRFITWESIGWGVPGLLLLAAVPGLLPRRLQPTSFRSRWTQRHWARAALWMAAMAMLARMILAPKIYHYGFFQAYLAGVWLVAFAVGEWPRLAVSTRSGRRLLGVVVLAFIAGIAYSAIDRSRALYGERVTPVGVGGDRVYAYRYSALPFSDSWETIRDEIVRKTSPDATLLVVPEGLTLNYWSRRKHPLPITDLLPATLQLCPVDVLQTLQAAPPEIVVFISPGNRPELGFTNYAKDCELGAAIISWVELNYVQVAAQGDDDVFANRSFGLRVFARRR